MNNTIFNFHRFSLLLKRQWLEFGKIFLISLLVVIGVVVAFYCIGLWPYLLNIEHKSTFDSPIRFREPLFLGLGFLFITVTASSYFAHLGQKSRAIIDLMLPASTFEKFLSGILFTSVLTTICFLGLFYLTDLIFIAKLRSMYDSIVTVSSYVDRGNHSHTSVDRLRYFFSDNEATGFKPLYIIPLLITSIFLLGSIYFNKYHYIKTAISVMIFMGLWSFIIFNMASWLFKNKVVVRSLEMSDGGNSEQWLAVLLLSVLTLIFWSITYIRLKEKEV